MFESELQTNTQIDRDSSTEQIVRTEPHRVLIVEDDESLKVILERVLHSIDPEVEYTWLTKAETAVSELRKQHYDLVIADHYLDGVATGLGLWRFCRRRFPGSGFVLMSGALGVDRFLRMTPGHHGSGLVFIPKPFKPSEVQTAVRLLLQRRDDGF